MRDVVLVVQGVGAALLLLAYLGLDRWWTDVQVQYLALNLAGGVLLAIAACQAGQWGFALLFVVWCLAALRSFVSLWLRQ